MTIIEAKNIVKKYGRIIALNNVSLIIKEGIEGLIGPNGAGKTTFINIVLGLAKSDSGYVKVYGFDPWKEGAKIKDRIGILHEKPRFPKSFTGREFLEVVASFYGYSIHEAKRKVDEIVKVIDLERFIDRKIGTYSAGIVQRIGLAQSLIGDPDFVILDEPTSNLDPTSRIEFLELIEQLNKDKGISFLISTHVLSELEKICQRVTILVNGVIKERGNVFDLVRKYVDQYVIETSDALKLYNKLKNLECIENIEIKGTKVYIETKKWSEVQLELFKIFYEEKMNIISITPRYGSLEQVYRRMIA